VCFHLAFRRFSEYLSSSCLVDDRPLALTGRKLSERQSARDARVVARLANLFTKGAPESADLYRFANRQTKIKI
jgi:hypothetical protein